MLSEVSSIKLGFIDSWTGEAEHYSSKSYSTNCGKKAERDRKTEGNRD
jgi:hypothetical protein